MCVSDENGGELLERLRVSGHDSEIPETVGATSDVPM